MLHVNDPIIREKLLDCNIGLEKESLRIDSDGHFAHTQNPFRGHKNIGTDYCENQTEINTPVAHSAKEAHEMLDRLNAEIHKKLAQMDPPEYLWPFSNPPYIINDDDIKPALFVGPLEYKNDYLIKITDRYGKYKMTFSGIHFNFSFTEELLQREFELSGEEDYTEFKNNFYVVLAERAAAYSWIVTAVTAASPVFDGSYVEKRAYDKTVFTGLASYRASEMGYWNFFAPFLNYNNIRDYADSIQTYVDQGILFAPAELYYPVRLKPRGVNNLPRLRNEGVDHIELRMVDLNPLERSGMNYYDVLFCQLLLVWLGATERQPFALKDQVQAIQNFKNAAHYDLKTVKILVPNGESYSVARAAMNIIGFMEEFFKDFPQEIQDCLAFEREKIEDPEKRYAWQLRKEYGENFVKKGVELAKAREKEYLELDI